MSYEDFLIRESVGDGTIDPDDVCYVCEKRDCVCPSDTDETLGLPEPVEPNENNETDSDYSQGPKSGDERDRYGYPINWPKCPSCGLPAMDGHVTCGQAQCSEGTHR